MNTLLAGKNAINKISCTFAERKTLLSNFIDSKNSFLELTSREKNPSLAAKYLEFALASVIDLESSVALLFKMNSSMTEILSFDIARPR